MSVINKQVRQLVEELKKFADAVAAAEPKSINSKMNELTEVVTLAIELLAREHGELVENVVLGTKFSGHLLANLIARARAQKLGPLRDVEKYVCIEDVIGKTKQSLMYSVCLDPEFDQCCEVDHG